MIKRLSRKDSIIIKTNNCVKKSLTKINFQYLFIFSGYLSLFLYFLHNAHWFIFRIV